jgi:hypothetical protein
MDTLELQTYPISRKKIPNSKYKMLGSKTVEEVSRTDERVDMGKLICRSTFRHGE